MSRRITDFLIRYRVALSIFTFTFLLLEDWKEGLKPRLLFTSSDPLGLLALALVSAGIFLRSWAAGMIRKGKELATTGPYSLFRHPLYVGSFLIGFGFSFALWDGAYFIAVILVAMLLYLPKIRQEEALLKSRFGTKWEEYSKRTGVFFPKKLPRVFEFWSFSQWFHNQEYQAMAVSVVVLLALHAVNVFHY